MARAGFASGITNPSDQMVNPARAVFLDRDGVLIHTNVVDGKAYAIRDVAEFRILPGVPEAVQKLKAAGYQTVMVTNQPDLDNGLVTPETVAEIHKRLQSILHLDGVCCCPHAARRACACRKPKPGMLLSAAAELNLDLKASWMVGDRASDVLAGKAAGCRTIFIDCGYRETLPTDQNATVRSLPEAVDIILSQTLETT